MTLPPVGDVIEVLTYVALPAVAVAFAVFMDRGESRWTPLAAALALALGFVVANQVRPAWSFHPSGDEKLTAWDALGRTLWLPETKGAPLPPSRYWLPWATAAALLAGMMARQMPAFFAWALRAAVAVLAARMLTPAQTPPWLVGGLIASIFALWAVLERLAEQERGPWVPAALSLAFAAAAAVLIHAHSASLTDVATMLSAALGGIALGSWRRPDAGGCVPGVAVALPGLLLIGQDTTFSDVPVTAFAAVALAPLTLVLVLLPGVRKAPGWLRLVLGAAALLGALAVGVGTALAYESLDFG